jgi:hypothetical protein
LITFPEISPHTTPSLSATCGLSAEITALAHQDAACARLMTVPGIGPIISSAMVAAIGNGAAFSKGRDFGAWLGLVPKQIPRKALRDDVLRLGRVQRVMAAYGWRLNAGKGRASGTLTRVPPLGPTP